MNILGISILKAIKDMAEIYSVIGLSFEVAKQSTLSKYNVFVLVLNEVVWIAFTDSNLIGTDI